MADTTKGPAPGRKGRINLVKPLRFVLMLIPAGAGSVLFAIGAAAIVIDVAPCILNEGSKCKADLPGLGYAGTATFMLLGALIFGMFGISAIQRVVRTNGWLEIQPTHFSLACYSLGPMSGLGGGYFSAGTTGWDNVAKVGLRRAFGTRCMGITFTDVSAFLESRNRLTDRSALAVATWGTRWNGILLDAGLLVPGMGKFLSLLMRVIGYSGMPKSSDDVDVLAWNEKNWGYHVLTPAWFVPDVDEVVAALQEHCQTNFQRPDSPTKALTAGESSVETRLQKLEELRRRELITAREYEKKREEILSTL